MVRERAEPILVSLSDSYSDDKILVCDRGTLLVLPTHSTDYFIYLLTCIDFGLKRPVYSKQYFKNSCYSSM